MKTLLSTMEKAKIMFRGQCYKFSMYRIILTDYNPSMITIFSTRTGKLVELSKNIFKTILESHETVIYSEYLWQLINCLLFIPYEQNEWKDLQDSRRCAIQERNKEPITNYVITPTMDCNARCAYCFEMGVHHDKMTIEVTQQLAEFICAHSGNTAVTIHWFGGEPLLTTDIIDTISSSLSKSNVDFISKITTNGYYLTSDIIKRAVEEWHTVSVQVTIDDIGDGYNAIKKYVQPCVENPFIRIMDNIQYTSFS